MSVANNPMNFNENLHGCMVLDKLKSLKEEGKFCDVILYVEGKQIRAHRNVLASCSPYFESVLKTHKNLKERLTITCQSSETFLCLLNYMYTGCVVIDKDNVSELLRLANHFLVSKLKTYCAEYLDRYLDVSNCLSVREMSEKYNLQALLKTATLFVQVNINKIVYQDEILNFTLPKLEAFLSEKAWTVPQNILLGLICRWVLKDIPVRERSVRALLTFVDWNVLDGAFISEHIDRESLYSTSEICLYFVLQSLVEHNILFPKYQGAYQTLQEKFSQGAYSLDSDTFLNMAVSTAIEGLHETSNVSPLSLTTNDQDPNDEPTLLEERKSDGISVTGCRKLVLKRRQRRMKQKFLASRRPGFRLSALKNGVSSRTKRMRMHQHMSEESGNQLPCHLCSHTAEDSAQLEQHLASTHSREVTYKCGLCGFVCHWNKEYYNHMKVAHFQGPPFKCDSCNYNCDKIHLLLSHRMQHSDERFHHCQECGYKCRSRSNLLAHLHTHSGDRPFKCETCGRAFTAKNILEQHLATHANDRPYTCDTCGFSTKFLSHLIAHKRIHSGDVYQCSYPQCHYSTPKKSQLGSHARTHGATRPHSCGICGRGFLEKSHLVRHERIHLDDKPFKCSQCEYASSRRDKLKEHFGRHHGEHASAKVPYRARPTRLNHKDGTSLNDSGPPSQVNHEIEHISQHNGPSNVQPPTAHPTATSAPYPAFPDVSHPPPLDFHHHHQQLLSSRSVGPPKDLSHHPHMHHQSPAAAMAAMMLDPRFHHHSPGNPPPGTYHPAAPLPPPSMGGGQSQQGSNQHHHQGEYPCMPLFG